VCWSAAAHANASGVFIRHEDLSNINDIDHRGDQAAHIAARLGHLDCIKLLIKHDARMGRKNFAALTPLGEATMNGNMDIAELIKDCYTTAKAKDDAVCDEISDDGWIEVWNKDTQKPQWERTLPNGVIETSATPPPANYQLVLKARLRCEDQIVRRNNSISSLILFKKQRRIKQERLELVLKERQRIVEERCAIKLQSIVRKKRARDATRQLRAQALAANRIKRMIGCFLQRKRENALIKIQTFVRMTAARVYFKEFLRERLYSYRAFRKLATVVQRLWRGFKGRSRFRRQLEITTLPNPENIRNHDYWVEMQIEAGKAKRELGVYAEYTLSGNPRSWRERNLVKRHDKFYRDVSFYVNVITRRASWSKPKGWVFNNANEYYALRVQTFWRARVAKRKILLLSKANKLLTNTFASTTSEIVSLCNYTFYVHVHLHDYEKARPLYAKMMSYMERRIDNAFVLYSYSIFAAVSGEEDWNEIKEFSRRAKIADDQRKRKRGDFAVSEYDIASSAFLLQAVANGELSGGSENFHNLALCQMLVQQDLLRARGSFLRAMKQAPSNKTLSSNYNVLLQDKDFLNHQKYSN
jgi:hypothetical protein